MAKRRTPTGNNGGDKITVSCRVSKEVNQELDADAARHFRSKDRHVAWIIQEYLNRTQRGKPGASHADP